ncbi:MAG: hypothetical protein ABJD11_08050 [Gemmatimonadota bacterium]
MMALSTAPLAGQQVAVLPLTLLVPTDSLSDLPPFDDHAHALLWADSIIGATLASRGPEVRWIFPPELRKIAHRSAGMVVDPDHMGQGIMRAPNLKIVPDPFRVSLRGLVALSGGRYAFIPAAMAYSREADGTLRAEISLVLADSRSGAVSWRTLATGFGPTPVRALTSALDKVFPLSLGFR